MMVAPAARAAATKRCIGSAISATRVVAEAHQCLSHMSTTTKAVLAPSKGTTVWLSRYSCRPTVDMCCERSVSALGGTAGEAKRMASVPPAGIGSAECSGGAVLARMHKQQTGSCDGAACSIGAVLGMVQCRASLLHKQHKQGHTKPPGIRARLRQLSYCILKLRPPPPPRSRPPAPPRLLHSCHSRE